MRSSKAKAAKKREQVKRQQDEEARQLAANAERLKNMKGGFSLAGYTGKPKSKEYIPPQVMRREYVGNTPAKPDPVYVAKARPNYSPEMLAREKAAQDEIALKKSLSMPLYNKGGNQVPTSMDLEAFRNGELRRR